MHVLVCISHVPDTTTKIQFDADAKALNSQGVTFIIGPFDEYGLSRAVELREAGTATKVVALCVGGPDVEPTIRKALAIGADEGVRIDAKTRDSFYIASQIAAYAKGKDFKLIFMGKESIEHNDSAVPGMVAEMLDMPFVSLANFLELKGDKAEVHREIEGGDEILETTLPVVLSAQKGIAEWRIPNMRGIMAARTKPLAVVPPAEAPQMVATARYELPPAKGGVKMIAPDQVDQLVTVLAEKGVI